MVRCERWVKIIQWVEPLIGMRVCYNEPQAHGGNGILYLARIHTHFKLTKEILANGNYNLQPTN